MFEMSGMSEAVIAPAQIILINVVLSGDNAVVTALACRRLSPQPPKKASHWGADGRRAPSRNCRRAYSNWRR